MAENMSVSMLILGAGWTSTFLIPQLNLAGISYAATTTTGRDGTLKFIFDPNSTSPEPYKVLPTAQTILITFPLTGKGASALLHRLYSATHPSITSRFLQLGSSGIFSVPEQTVWVTRHSAYDTANSRAVAEDELLGLGGCVLNLSGLWGAARQPRNWVERVAATKEQLCQKTSLHMIHGEDVARAIVAVSLNFTPGERWMLTDLFVYDWWALILGWCGSPKDDSGGTGVRNVLPQLQWIQELLVEKNIMALPRSPEQLGRCYDSREFWIRFGLMPVNARI